MARVRRARGAEHPALAALRFFRRGVGKRGRLPLYAALLDTLIADVETGGVCAELLSEPGPDPVDDAVPLRLLGAVHRLVLVGQAPALAAFYPSAGGSFSGADGGRAGEVFLSTVAANRDDVAAGLARPVQTNEVGRNRALLLGFLEVAEATGLPLRVLEIGSSAGLNLRWDRYRYEGGSGGSAFGPLNSPVRLGPAYRDDPPDLDRLAVVVERRGCDASPLDPTSPDDQLTLRSFVWPEQADRLARLDGAFEVAGTVATPVDRADAADWLDEQLADNVAARGTTTVVFHSIVWQYFSGRTRSRLLSTLHRAGGAATAHAPLAWLRMEPAGGSVAAKATEILVTRWPGGDELLLGQAGYHGQWVAAAPRSPSSDDRQ
ncbi:MAG: DUF2332 domain-containing protein [Acidimicrobiales bacterium]